MKIGRLFLSAACAAMSFAISPGAMAGGFMLQEQSQLEIGRAFSGGAAAADSPATIYYNPAGMTELEGLQVTTGATLLFINSKQKNMGTTRTGPGATPTQAVNGGDGVNPFAPVVPVPTTYASWHVGDSKLWLGFGISAPFGLKLRYKDDFFGRYDSLYSNLLTLNAQPSFAYKLNDAVSIGGGVDIQYADATLTNALPRVNPSDPDGQARLAGDDVSLGWNMGVLFKLSQVQLGFHYRSRIKHELKGDYTVSDLTGTAAALNGKTDIVSPLTLPDSYTASLAAPLDAKTRLMITGRYYNWSLFESIRVILPSGAVARKEYAYKDSWSLSAGIDHRISKKLTLRAGSMFDKTPTNPDFLSTRIPDGDRTWASAGLSYGMNDHITINASYAHVFIKKQEMVRTESASSTGGILSVTTRSQSSGNVDMIATSITARF